MSCAIREAFYIIEGTGVLVKGRVQESYSALAGRKTLLVNQGDNAREDWRGGASTTDESWLAIIVEEDVLAKCRHIWIATSGGIIDGRAVNGIVVRWRGGLEV
jgi:hypothetical protein